MTFTIKYYNKMTNIVCIQFYIIDTAGYFMCLKKSVAQKFCPQKFKKKGGLRNIERKGVEVKGQVQIKRGGLDPWLLLCIPF